MTVSSVGNRFIVDTFCLREESQRCSSSSWLSSVSSDCRAGPVQSEDQVRDGEGHGVRDHDEAAERAESLEGGRRHLLLAPSHVCQPVRSPPSVQDVMGGKQARETFPFTTCRLARLVWSLAPWQPRPCLVANGAVVVVEPSLPLV